MRMQRLICLIFLIKRVIVLAKKIKMLEFYKTQFVAKRNYFTKEFIEGLARVRGAQVNCEFAESFEVIRAQMK